MYIEKAITRQIAHCLALYGDQPEELMIKLQELVMEWFTKGQTGFTLDFMRQYLEALKVVEEFGIAD